jgi:hypothetical protein
MRDPNGHPPLDVHRIFMILAAHCVDYVLVGGVAAQLHGATRATDDFDLCPSYDRRNLVRLVAALNALGATFRGIWDELPPVSVESLRRMDIATWRTTAGDIDVLVGIPGAASLMGYADLRRRAVVYRPVGSEVQVACLQDIIDSKEYAMRASYREALNELHALSAGRRAPV